MPTPEPLGRSLVPLPDESLPGYILRLSYRLNLTPARLAELTGLAPKGRSGVWAPASLLAEIPEPTRHTFAHMTRLSLDTVTQLGLNCLRRRYPLSAETTGSSAPEPQSLTSPSFFAPATRYCPECLTGDRTPIQEAFGGAWRRTWHLPVVFACPSHRRLLEHHCPACDQPVHGRHSGRFALLLPTMHTGMLHPAQCRAVLNPGMGQTQNTCCGTRLDHTRQLRPADSGLLALQDKILDLLAPNGSASTPSAGHQTEPISYFTDLQALTLLTCTTWPTLRDFSPSEETAAAIDEHVESIQQRTAERQNKTPVTKARNISGPPPADAAASAGLTYIADRILLSGGPDTIREYLRPLLPATTRQASRTAWGDRVTRSTALCSEGLRAAYMPLLRGFTKIGSQPQARRAAAIHPQRWGPQHIPAFAPKSWCDKHFNNTEGISTTLLRRTVSVRLIQMIAGGSLGEAAQFLGINHTGKQYTTATNIHRWARSLPDPHQFEAALHALANELDSSSHLIDYQRRRQALETWSINKTTWNELVLRLPPVSGPQQPELGDRKRQIASIYVWVQLTSGEHHFAPRTIEAAQPPQVRRAWDLRRGTIWHLMQSPRPLPHYASLKAELHTLANSLAQTIDPPATEHQPPTTTGNRHL